MRIFILFFILFISHHNAIADTITKVSGNVLSGTFSSKSSGTPILFDNFENGVNGDSLPDHSDWSPYALQPGGYYNNNNSYSGNLSAYNYIDSEGAGFNEFNTSYYQFTACNEVYITYMYKIVGTGSKAGIGKGCRITSSGSAGGGGVYNGAGDSTWNNINLYYSEYGYVAYNDGVKGDKIIGNVYCDEGQWVRVEMYKKLSTAGDDDGIMWAKSIGISEAISESAMTRATGQTFQQDTVMLGLMYANIGYLNPPASVKIWIDDVYIDNTQQRVEIGNNPTFSSCTHREIQIPTSWSDISITITVNQGSFQDGELVHVFVINAAGEASAGFPAIISGGQLSPPPIQANNLTANNVTFGG